MITRILYDEEKIDYDRHVQHPVQTWAWGDFQITQGHKIYRLGVFDNDKMVSAYSVSFHQIPHTSYSIGTILRGPSINQDMITNIKKIAADENAVFIKFEPDVYQKTFDANNHPSSEIEPINFPDLVISPKVAFYPYSYVIDLTKSEDDLLSAMRPKTRYNIKIANRNNVEVHEDSTDAGFEVYLKLLFETTKRQGFYLHSEKYHHQLWDTLKPTGMVHIMLSKFQNQTLSAYMLFVLKDKLFYPYGSSLAVHKEVMAQNLLMWETIKFGRSLSLKSFDMWGCLGPDARETDNGYGFHYFKQGYGGQLVQFVGTYDLVINRQLYQLYNLIDKYRWKLLRLKASLFSR